MVDNRLHRLSLYQLEDHVTGIHPHLVLRVNRGGQARQDVGAELVVVKADDANVVRDL